MKRTRYALFALALVLCILAVGVSDGVDIAHAASASLYLSPSSNSVNVDDSFTVVVYVSTDTAMNSAEATVTFPTHLLQVTSVSQSGIISLWAEQPAYSNSKGTVTFAGGLPNPGYTGKSGKLISITFKAKAAGKAKVAITGGSVLENSANANELLTSQGSGTYTISVPVTPPTNTTPPPTTQTSAPSISSDAQADQSKWYNNRNVSASWQAGAGSKGFSVVFDKNADTVAPENVTTTSASFSNSDVADGTWYLHVRVKYDQGWSSTTTFRYHIDATPPDPFTIEVLGDPQLKFESKDATSGIDHYEVLLDNGAFATVSSPYTTPSLNPGKHTVNVRAYDKAGNFREASTTFDVTGYAQPTIIDLTPVAVGGEPIVMRGFSNAQDSIRLTIDNVEYGPYPVADYIDPNPPTPPPAGTVAWKINIKSDVGPGEHVVTFTALGPNGEVSSQTPPVKFKVVTNAVRLGGKVVKTVLIINLLIIVGGLLLLVAAYFATRYFMLRHRLRHSSVDMLKPAAGGKHIVKTKALKELNEVDVLEQYILKKASELKKKDDTPHGSQKK